MKDEKLKCDNGCKLKKGEPLYDWSINGVCLCTICMLEYLQSRGVISSDLKFLGNVGGLKNKNQNI